MAADYVPLTNLRGPAARITGTSAESVPAGDSAAVVMSGLDQDRQFAFKIPRGLPGVNAVENDEAVAAYVSAADSETSAALNAAVGKGFAAMDRVSTLVKMPEVRAYAAANDSMQRIKLPTHVADKFQATHPSVKFFPEGWNGWRYWMGFTPYPSGNDAHEDPCIAVSQDGKTWTTPAGFTNPLDDAPGGVQYNADTELAISPDGSTLYCMWRLANTSTRVVQFKVRSTTDGVNWTPAVVAMTHADYNVANYVSPTLAHDGAQWVMWGIDAAASPNTLVRLTAPAVTGPWSAATVCTASAGVARDFWHISVIRASDGYVALVNDTTLNIAGADGDLYLMTSPDGLTWTRGWPLFERPFGTQFTALYRGTLVATDSGFDVWFGAYNASNQWGIFRAQIRNDPALRASASKWLPAWDFRPPIAGPSEGVLFSIINGWLLDAAAPESVGTTVEMPGWKRFAAEIWFATTTAAAGGVAFTMNYRQITDGGTLAAAPQLPTVVTEVPAVLGSVRKATVIVSIPIAADGPWYLRAMRDAANAADTYPADVLFLGLKLLRMA